MGSKSPAKSSDSILVDIEREHTFGKEHSSLVGSVQTISSQKDSYYCTPSVSLAAQANQPDVIYYHREDNVLAGNSSVSEFSYVTDECLNVEMKELQESAHMTACQDETESVGNSLHVSSLNLQHFQSCDSYATYEATDHKAFHQILSPCFPEGKVRISRIDDDETKDRFYMIAQKDSSMDDIALYIANRWQRNTPKLVLSIIGRSDYHVPWLKTKFMEDFHDGIIQAANSTGMWILTEGFDYGVSKLIGDTIHCEMQRRKNIFHNPLCIQNLHKEERLPRLNIFGILSKKNLAYGTDIMGTNPTVSDRVTNTGGNPADKLYDLNAGHTHFIFLDDVGFPDWDALNSFRFSFEMRLTKPVGRPRRYHHISTGTQPSTILSNQLDVSTPVIGLLVQGGPSDIDHVLWLLQKKMPVIVIEGSGLAADLIAFTLTEMEQRSDPGYLDSFIKGELMRRVSEAFPEDFANNEVARNLYRDRIIECVKLTHQDNLTFLTVVSVHSYGVRLNDLSKYLLMALFKSRTAHERHHGEQWKEQLMWDLQLTLDWNRPDLARSEIFDKFNVGAFKVTNTVVHLALIRPNREEFMRLFFEQGWQVHPYLNHKRLHNLFENPADMEFFITICLEGVLGKAVNPCRPVCHNFVDNVQCELNRLLCKCTGLSSLVNPYELSMNSIGSYVTEKEVAERRALNSLIIWAALSCRYKMAKLLWKQAEEPMAVALIVSMLLYRLGTVWCKKDMDMRKRVKHAAVDFGKMAVSILDVSYKESSMHTFSALGKRLEDFNNRTVVQLAWMGGNKYFLAHPCCQKWLTQRWFGNIHIREMDWGPSFKLPDGLKIYFSVLLILPMFFWISWHEKDDDDNEEEEDEDGQEDVREQSMLLRVTSMEDRLMNQKKKMLRFSLPHSTEKIHQIHIAFWKRLYYLWSAPITKFWFSQLMYFAYLMLMSAALLMPGCGMFFLDMVVFLWTSTIFLEFIRRTVVHKSQYPDQSLTWAVVEIMIVFLFLMLMLGIRILPHFVTYISFPLTKFFMSVYLLFFFFRFIAMTVPVSQTLGPMYVSILTMTKKDFLDWMRLFLMVLISGAVTIQAVIYPSFPFGSELLRQAFSRAIFGLFLTKIDDLDGAPCSELYEQNDVGYCPGNKYLNESVHNELARCPHGSIVNYLVVIPYLVNAKLIFITLLYAMFAVTTAKVYQESVEIWRYQRYKMIVEFEERPILPPPLSLLNYIFCILRSMWQVACHVFKLVCSQSVKICRKDTDKKDCSSRNAIHKYRRTSDYNYWKECMHHFSEGEQAELLEEKRAEIQSDCLEQLLEQTNKQQQVNRQLNDRLVKLETDLTNSCVLLEEMKHMIKRLDPATPTNVLPKEPKKVIHVYARQTPYVFTHVRRYPVFDKFVPWEVPYDAYDPVTYSKPVCQFTKKIQMLVDPDVLEIMEEQTKRQGLSAEELEKLPPLPEFRPQYNIVISTVVDDNVHVEINRTSLISINSQPLRYELDFLGMPINPLGRTGLRGRGKLWHFGPNHRMTAVITRWRRKYSKQGLAMDYLLVDGKQVLECLVITKPDESERSLPGGNVYGRTTSYSVLCEELMTSVFQEEEVEGSLKLDQEDMIRYFAQFASKTEISQKSSAQPVDMTSSGFSASVIYRGYIDDPANTDNAWREAEVWNFHYNLHDTFDERLQQWENLWQEVMPNMHLYGNQDSIVQEAARIHNAYR